MTATVPDLRTFDRRRDRVAPILQTLHASRRFQTLIAALAATGLSEPLKSPGGAITLFAPSDHAFERMPIETVRQWLSHPDLLRAVLQGHMVDGEYSERDLIPFTRVPSRSGAGLHFSATDQGDIFVNGVEVLTTDILASNGVIHELDGVILPD
jgi:uncharacterized surface protein with fasciclin (FAS1) repeats